MGDEDTHIALERWAVLVMNKLLAVLLCVSLVLGGASPALAQSGPTGSDGDTPVHRVFLPSVSSATGATATGQNPQQIAEQQLAQKIRYEEAIRRMEAHLYLAKDGQLRLNVTSGSEIGVPEDIFTELQASLGYLNGQVRTGALRLEEVSLSSGQNIYGQEVPLTVVATGTPAGLAPQAVACAGWTGIRWFWYGPRVYYDDCRTHDLLDLMLMGAGVATLCAVLTEAGAVPCGVVGGLLAIGRGAISMIDRWGGHRGIYIQVTWLWQIRWVWHQ